MALSVEDIRAKFPIKTTMVLTFADDCRALAARLRSGNFGGGTGGQNGSGGGYCSAWQKYSIKVANNISPSTDNTQLPTSDNDAIADTGASGHFLQPGAPHEPSDRQAPPIRVKEPSGAYMQSSKNCKLVLRSLSEAARHAHILPGLSHSSLVSIGVLCDAGCTAIFDANSLRIISKEGKVVL